MKIKGIILGILAAMLLSGCGPEVYLAKQFVQPSKPYRAAVYFPEEAQVTLIQNDEGEYTKVLDSLNQDAFLDIIYAAYAEELGRYGVEVYVPEDPDSIEVDSTDWLLMLSKMEIQGLFTPYVDQLFDLIDTYEYTFALNTVNVASWFDVNDGQWRPTLFYEHNLRDDFRSRVSRSRENGTQYHYDIKTLTIEDVYNYAVFLGRTYADYTFNYMMNRYILREMAHKNAYPRFKLRWDPMEKTFSFQEEEEGFMELEAEE